jgi:hypothetical protein
VSLTGALLIAGLAGAALCSAVALGALLLQGATSVLGAMRCLREGNHDPVPHVLGGFRCARCGLPGADLSDFDMAGGVPTDGYVGTHQVLYDREHGSIERRPW